MDWRAAVQVVFVQANYAVQTKMVYISKVYVYTNVHNILLGWLRVQDTLSSDTLSRDKATAKAEAKARLRIKLRLRLGLRLRLKPRLKLRLRLRLSFLSTKCPATKCLVPVG